MRPVPLAERGGQSPSSHLSDRAQGHRNLMPVPGRVSASGRELDMKHPGPGRSPGKANLQGQVHAGPMRHAGNAACCQLTSGGPAPRRAGTPRLKLADLPEKDQRQREHAFKTHPPRQLGSLSNSAGGADSITTASVRDFSRTDPAGKRIEEESPGAVKGQRETEVRKSSIPTSRGREFPTPAEMSFQI